MFFPFLRIRFETRSDEQTCRLNLIYFKKPKDEKPFKIKGENYKTNRDQLVVSVK